MHHGGRLPLPSGADLGLAVIELPDGVRGIRQVPPQPGDLILQVLSVLMACLAGVSAALFFLPQVLCHSFFQAFFHQPLVFLVS